jgi:hypothetical protein
MKIILPLVAIASLLAPALLLVGCSSLTTQHADRTWERVGEPWTQRPPGCADTVRTIDAEGNPSFGPR